MRIRGFSIPELIIVIATIGILASIVVVGYNGVQNKANDAAVQSDMESISGLLEAYRVNPNNPNEFPRTKAILDTLGIKASKKSYKTTMSLNLTYCIDNDGADAYQLYKLIATSKSGKIFVLTQDGFTGHSLTESNITSNLCNSLSMGLVSNGMYQPDNWQTWVGDS